MPNLANRFDQFDLSFTTWMARYGITLLRLSVGIAFLWFGILKFFPGLSPAEDLATRTTSILTFSLVPARTALLILAAWECVVGPALISGIFLRVTLLLLWLQMIGTIARVFFFPRDVFSHFPYAPTLEGQYIIKNLVLASAGIVVGATVRGARLRN